MSHIFSSSGVSTVMCVHMISSLYFYIFEFLFSFLLGKGGDSLLTISCLLNGGDKIYEMLALYTAELLHVTQMVGA